MLDQVLKGSETKPGSCLITPANEPICKRGKGVDGAVIFSMNRCRAVPPNESLRHAAGPRDWLVEEWKGGLKQKKRRNKISFSQASLGCNVYHRKYTVVGIVRGRI